jgi:hypothetical protein
MRVFQIDPLQDRRWNRLIEGHPYSSVFHRPEWLQALKSSYGYEPAALSLCSPDAPLTNALVFCRIRSALTGKRLVSLPFSDHCEPLTRSPEEAESLITGLKAMAGPKEWKYVELRTTGAFSDMPGLLDISVTHFLHRLNLGPSEDELFKGLHKDCVQRKIRRAGKESLRCEEGASDTLVHLFYRLLIMTRCRRRLPPQPLRWFRSLVASFGKRLSIRVAFKGDIPIAGTLTLSHRDTVTYKYACSDARFHNLGGPALLLWTAISEAKRQGFEEFDMGRSTVDNTGLVRFKDRWGAARSVLTYWRYPAASRSHTYEWATNAMKRLAPFAPKESLTLLGRLLYRHIG